MNLNEMLNELAVAAKKLGLSPSDIRISSGSALMFYNLRTETSDVDVSVPGGIFKILEANEDLQKVYFVSMLNGATRCIVKVGKVDFHNEDDTPEFNGATIDFSGYRVDAPETILAMKIKLARPKDEADIANLKELISRR